jgi:inner membrane transporter RhtA
MLQANSAAPSREVSLARGATGLRDAVGSVPPTGLIILSMLSVQLGAAAAKGMFHTIGPAGTVSLRVVFGAVVLLAVGRPRLRGHTRAEYGMVLLFGLTMAGMNLSFYAALARIPLGIAVTVEFLGPLAVAVAGSRRRLDLLWAAFAAAGILLLSPFVGARLDPLGIVLALCAACGWAAYILLAGRAGRAFPGVEGLALGMGVSAAALLPVGLVAGGSALLSPELLLQGAGVALLASVLPFSLEFEALKRIPAHVFGVLMSMEPAVAALVGLLLLGEAISLRMLAALALVSAATVGATRSSKHGPSA